MKKYLFFLIFLLSSYSVHAQNIQIDADQKVEWYRDEQKIIAYGNAIATKNNDTLKGDKLTAFYETIQSENQPAKDQLRKIIAEGNASATKNNNILTGKQLTAIYETIQLENGTKKNQLQKILSDKDVTIKMNNSTGLGEHFDYDIPTEIAKLTGKPAKLNSENGEITATDHITYYLKENKSIAMGNVVAKNHDYTIYSNKMIGYFEKDKQGQNKLKYVEIIADNNPIKIVNQQAEVTGEKGIYLPLENKIKIYNNVVINQNNDILKGNYAETDLKTGISRLLGQQGKNGRVFGVFRNKNKK